MSTPPSSTWELSSSADYNAHVGLPSQTSSDDAARMIAAAVENADPQSETDTLTGSPLPAQPEEPAWEDDWTNELRASLPQHLPGNTRAAAPDSASIPEDPTWDDDLGNELRATYPHGPQGQFAADGEVIGDDEQEQVSEYPERSAATRAVLAAPTMPGDPDLSNLDEGQGAWERILNARRPSRPSSQTKRTAEDNIEPVTTPRRRT